MKAHRNMRSHFSIISQALLVLCCIALLAPRPAEAQDRIRVDENGRALGTLPGAPTLNIMANPGTLVARDVLKEGECDMDDCSTFVVRESTDQILGKTLTSSLSFQVQAGAPENSINVAPDGNIGIGTKTPRGRLHVVARSGEEGAAADIFLLDNNGNLEIGGLLTEASSVLLKEHFVAIDGQDVLARLAKLPITTWNYKTDAPSIRHMGPMAQDFFAAFGLGSDERHIAPLDVNGVALAGIQALSQHVQTQAREIATLEQQNADLLQRLEALEALVLERDK